MSYLATGRSYVAQLVRQAVTLPSKRPDMVALMLPKTRGPTRWVLLSFLAFVVLPTIGCFGYWSIIAPVEYVSEAKLVIKSAAEDPMRLTNDAMSILSAMTAPQVGTQETHIVANYIQSRTIIDDLGGRSTLLGYYGMPSVYYFARLHKDSSVEKRWRYWLGKVEAIIDVPSGILNLEVRAFSPNDAHDLATRIVAAGENLVNQMSARVRADALGFAEAELLKAKSLVSEKQLAVLKFRNTQETLDPVTRATQLGEILSDLTREKLKVEGDAAILQKSLATDALSLRALRSRLENLDNQIAGIQSYMASNAEKSGVVASQLGAYESLQLEVKFAERLYEVADAAYQKAHQDVQKQQVYLVTVVKPSLAETASYPRPFLDSLLLFIWASVLWSVITLTLAGIFDHR